MKIGEYWLQDTDVIFADGDIGDTNHEGPALQHVRSMVLCELGYDPDWETLNDDDCFREQLANALENVDEEIGFIDQIRRAAPDIEKKYPRILDAAFNNISGSHEDNVTDIREWCIKYLDWIWVNGCTIGIAKLDQDSLENLRSGISDVLEQECVMEEDEDLEYRFNLHVLANGYNYSITWGELKNREWSALLPTSAAAEAGRSDQVKQLDKAEEPKCYANKHGE
jgi:hypothetical protein